MSVVVLMSVFGFLVMLDIAGFLSKVSAIVSSLIGLVVIFFELGAQENFIEITEKALFNYFDGTGFLSIYGLFALIAFGFILEIIGAIL